MDTSAEVGGLSSLPLFSERTIEISWLAIAVLVPSALNPWGISAFGLPKSAVFLTFVFLMILCRLVISPRHQSSVHPSVQLMIRAVSLYALVLLLATVLSVNPRLSLMGSLERQQGLLFHLGSIFLFITVAQGVQTEVQFRRLILALVLGSVIPVGYGLLQAVSLDPVEWQTDGASRVLSTFGRANFFGSYLVLIIPLTLSQLLIFRKKMPFHKMKGIGVLLLLAGQLICLVFTLARGAWIGFLAVAAVYALGSGILFRNRRMILVVIALLVVFIALILFLRMPVASLQPITRMPGMERLATLTDFDRGSTAARLTVWRFTLPLILERPWLGHGHETMYEVFVRVFPPQLIYYQGRHVTIDRAHNLWLDLAMTTGVIGVIAFGAILVGFAKLVWTGLRSSSKYWHKHLWIGLSASAAGFLVDQQFSFSLAGSSVVFWLILAMGTALAGGLDRAIQQRKVSSSISWIQALSVAILLVILVALFCVRPLLADSLAWHSQQRDVELHRAIAIARDAVWLEPREPSYQTQLSWLYLNNGEFESAEQAILAAERLSPNDPRIHSARGELYAVWGIEDIAQYEKAERACRRALELAPHVAAYHTALGIVVAHQGRLDEGIRAVERAIDLDTTDGVAYAHLAELYQTVGREADAFHARKQAIRWGAIRE